MFECSLQPHDVFFVIWIGLFKFIQHLYFLETRFVPKKWNQKGADGCAKESSHGLLTPDDLDSDLPANICRFPVDYPSTYHVGKHSFAKGGENLVASAVKLFTKDHRVISFWIRSRIQRCRDESGSSGFLKGCERHDG